MTFFDLFSGLAFWVVVLWTIWFLRIKCNISATDALRTLVAEFKSLAEANWTPAALNAMLILAMVGLTAVFLLVPGLRNVVRFAFSPNNAGPIVDMVFFGFLLIVIAATGLLSVVLVRRVQR